MLFNAWCFTAIFVPQFLQYDGGLPEAKLLFNNMLFSDFSDNSVFIVQVSSWMMMVFGEMMRITGAHTPHTALTTLASPLTTTAHRPPL